MSASFVVGSSQTLTNVPDDNNFGNVPFTIGMWVNVHTLTGVPYLWCAASNTTDTDYHYIAINASSKYEIGSISGTPQSGVAATATSAVVDSWAFVLGRWISIANRRLAVLPATGASFAAQDTTTVNRTTTGTVVSLGSYQGFTPTQYLTGMIAEYWVSNRDCVPGGGAIDAGYLRQIAFGGPLSIPLIAGSLMEYQSFRTLPSLGALGESLFTKSANTNGSNGFGMPAINQLSINLNGVQLGPDPPLPYSYLRPGSRALVLPI